MKKLQWQIVVVVVTLVVVGVLLIVKQPGEKLFAPSPTSGGVYTEALVGAASRLNPLLDLSNPADRDVDRLIYSGLIKFDSRGVPIADVAESWGTSMDGTTYNFSIRPNAKWHDGEPVTSADVIFTVDLMKSDISSYPADVKNLWQEVQIKELDDKTLQFILPEPFAPFLDYATFPLLPKHLLENVPVDQIPNAEFNLAPVGTGPYKFKRLIVEDGQIAGIELVPNTDFYNKLPYIEQVILRYFPTSEAALEAYKQGEVMAVSHLTPDVLADAFAQTNLAVYTGRLPRIAMVMFNLKNPEKPFLDETTVRRALMIGLNRQYIVDRMLGGQAIVADSPIFPDTWAYFDQTPHVDYNADEATSILKNAGYVIPAGGGEVRAKENTALEFNLIYPDDEQHAAIANQIKDDWAKIGVKVNLEALPYDVLLNDRLKTRNYEAALIDLNLTLTPDPDPYPFWHQSEATGGQNYSQWDNPIASEYIEQARVTTDPEKRTRLYRNFQVIFAQEVPAIPLYYPVYSFGVDKQVQGVQLPPMFDSSDRYSNITDWYLVTRRALEQNDQTQETSQP